MHRGNLCNSGGVSQRKQIKRRLSGKKLRCNSSFDRRRQARLDYAIHMYSTYVCTYAGQLNNLSNKMHVGGGARAAYVMPKSSTV